MDRSAVGARIRAARARLDMKQVDLAESVGVRAHTMLRYEKGKLLPGSEVLAKIAHALGETTATLLYGHRESRVERHASTAVADFLEQMGSRVTPEHARILQSINFGGTVPTVVTIAGIWGELRAADAGRAVPAHVIEPPPLPEGVRRLPTKPKR